MLYPSQLDIDWFNRKFEKKSENECWNWVAGKLGNYGQYHYNNYPVLAHRFAYLLAHPDFNQLLCVLHKCDNPLCVNPGHLFVGTSQENTADKVAKGRQCKGELNAASIITEEQVKEIRSKYKAGQASQRKLARMYKVSQATIWGIVNGKHWTHISNN